MQNFSAFASLTTFPGAFSSRIAAGLKRLLLCALAVVLAACSLARFGYDHGETILYWWANAYVGFHDSQKSWAEQHIAQLMAWHRNTQLKDYVQLLRHAQLRLQRPLGAAEVLADYDELSKRVSPIVERTLPDLADFVLMADARNIARLQKKFAANNEEFRRQYLAGDEQAQREESFRKIMEQAEYWFGDFSYEQEMQIRRASDARPLNNQIWLDDRIRRQQALLALLNRVQRERLTREAVIGLLRNYIESNYPVSAAANPEMRAFAEESKQGVAQMVVLIVNMATPKQKAHAHDRLQKWIDDFNALASGSEVGQNATDQNSLETIR